MTIWLSSTNKQSGRHLTFKLTAIVLALMLAPIFAVGQTRRKSTAPADQIKEQVLDVYRRINEASMRNDFDESDRLMADDYVAFGPDGKLIADKSSVLSLMKSGRMKIRYNKDITLRVTVDGDRATITGESVLGQELNGHLFKLRYKFSDVFESRKGQWQIVRSRLIRFLPKQ